MSTFSKFMPPESPAISGILGASGAKQRRNKEIESKLERAMERSGAKASGIGEMKGHVLTLARKGDTRTPPWTLLLICSHTIRTV